ncbi:MAG: hypothetical protein K940chlam7_00827 [Chlamydiae bacterium]|nr:hypothetical protein [Chlamydiota bacterium]
MRLDVKKYLFVGYHRVLEQFFLKAQEAALVHFIETGHLKTKEMPNDIQNMMTAIKILGELPTLDQERPEDYFETDSITDKVLEIRHAIEKLEEEQRMMRLEIARVEVFGEFSMEDIAYLEKEGNRKVQFFFAKRGAVDGVSLPKELVRVASDHGLNYYIAINPQPMQYENMIEMRIEHELGTLKKRYAQIQHEIAEKEQELKAYAKYNQFLHQGLVRKYNDYNLETAKKSANPEMEGNLFAVEGWVPENKIDQLHEMLKELDVHVVEIAIEPNELVPTFLENKGASRIGEDLVHIYDTPANTDKDPSLWVLLSFAIFFAMIIGDGGYGLVFLCAALYFRYKNPKLQKTPNRIWKLCVILFSFCILWGVLTNSFFGINFAPDSSVRKVSVQNWMVEKKAAYHFEKKDQVYKGWVAEYPELENATTSQEFLLGAKKESNGKVTYAMLNSFSDGIMMELALLAGIIHICLSLLRYLDRHWAGIGWIIAIIGCYLSFPKMLQATSLMHYIFGVDRELIAVEGAYMIYGGLALALVLALIKDKFLGLLEITNLIQIFADILSYLRLYALGLAGAIISGIVNDIAGSIFFLGGGLLLLLGHSLNMALAVIGGVIHGLRLNFIEWYHYSFEGGGKLFNPLRKMKIE